MKRTTLYAWLIGVMEFRQTFTTHFDGYQIEAYDKGRDLAHRLTLRAYDQ